VWWHILTAGFVAGVTRSHRSPKDRRGRGIVRWNNFVSSFVAGCASRSHRSSKGRKREGPQGYTATCMWIHYCMWSHSHPHGYMALHKDTH
jgi:hypothetical protein